MLIAYDSKTGNVRRFISKLNMPAVLIDDNLTLNEPYIVVTYTTGFGQVPPKVDHFLKRNHQHLAGAAASGNRNWGDGFAKSADTIAAAYGVPIIHKFELSGTNKDVEQFLKEVSLVAAYRTEQPAYAAR